MKSTPQDHASTTKSPPKGGQRVRDARGRIVSRLDPVAMYLLNRPFPIPPDPLRSMATQLLPNVRRQRITQVLSMLGSVLFIVVGNIIYFRYYSTWKGVDSVAATIYVVQALVILSGPLLVFLMARSGYAGRVVQVMLEHRFCPHCGYDIHGLPAEPADGATVCPECGCAWNLSAVN